MVFPLKEDNQRSSRHDGGKCSPTDPSRQTSFRRHCIDRRRPDPRRGSWYYLLAVLAGPIARETGWPGTWIIGAFSLGLLTSGLISPRVGHLIERFGGRPILAASAVLLAIGLLMQAIAPDLPVFVAAWLVIGLAMGAGLYDPAFATLGRLYGEHARSAITHLTLFGGFASTVCWPLSAMFVERFGWRGASAAYAAIAVIVVLPLYLLGVPREEHRPVSTRQGARFGTAATSRRTGDRVAFVILAAGLTVASVIMTVMSVHLLVLLQTRGLTLATAVGLGALIGPAQVGARVLEAAFGRRQHPVWSFAIATVAVAVGFGCCSARPASWAPASCCMARAAAFARSLAAPYRLCCSAARATPFSGLAGHADPDRPGRIAFVGQLARNTLVPV